MDLLNPTEMTGILMKVGAVAVTSTVVLPYIAALLCNLAYGWPQVRHRYRRAFHPRKVYALNLCIIQSIMLSLRYATLYFQWKAFYKVATASQVMKDREYGQRGQKLDLYFPKHQGSGDTGPHPVVVFAYGGAWGSGNKNMYGLLCSEVANKLGAIVCCPNHSTYPQGFVDDMVQDMIECLRWLHQNVEQYNGAKDNIMLLGHSSGAHLCAMTMLELFHDELLPAEETNYLSISPVTLQFKEKHFSANSDNEDRPSSGLAESFQVLEGQKSNVAQNSDTDKMSLSSSQFVVLETQKSETEVSEGSLLESEIQELTQSEISGLRYRGTSQDVVQSTSCVEGTSVGEIEDVTDEDSVITVRHRVVEPLPNLAYLQPSLIELRKSVKAVIGIAGVYHIGDHFLHESKRGVEDISTMSRAMRGPENFDRFSPTHIISKLTTSPGFPQVVLLHGTEDHVVPLTSTTHYADELKRIRVDVRLCIIPSCDHYEICMDLMKPNRNFHKPVMKILEATANSAFS